MVTARHTAVRARAAGRGFTLPEVLIVGAVLAVLLAAGAPHLGDFMRNQRVKTASFDLFSSLVLARSEAITRNTRVTVAPAGGSWANGWTITETGGQVLRRQEPVVDVSISGPATPKIIWMRNQDLTEPIIAQHWKRLRSGYSSISSISEPPRMPNQ